MKPDDAAAAFALVYGALGFTPYVDRVVELLRQAARGADPEARALVIERDGTIAGLVMFGIVAGTASTAKMHALVIDQAVAADDIGRRLLAAATSAAGSDGATIVVAELPDDAAFGASHGALLNGGFIEEGRVADFFREGVALLIFRRDVC